MTASDRRRDGARLKVTDVGKANERPTNGSPHNAGWVSVDQISISRGVHDAIGEFSRLHGSVGHSARVSLVDRWRSGMVIAITYRWCSPPPWPYVTVGIELRISLGALIIAHLLLVDDAMTSWNSWSGSSKRGSRNLRATFAYSSTAFPMQTGTLITVAGFIPLASRRRPQANKSDPLLRWSASRWDVVVLRRQFYPPLARHMISDSGHTPAGQHESSTHPFRRLHGAVAGRPARVIV